MPPHPAKRIMSVATAGAIAAVGLLPAVASAAPTYGTDLDPANGCDQQCATPAKVRNIDGVKYDLVWNDEFDGSEIDPTKWKESTTPENGRFCYANVSEGPKSGRNYYVDNGALTIQGLWNNPANPVCAEPNKDAYSGSLTTQGLAHWKYGRYEVRARIASGDGMWPAIWMMPEHAPYGWPKDGEIDWIETIGNQNTPTQGIMHTAIQVSKTDPTQPREPYIPVMPGTGQAIKKLDDTDLGAKFHTYEMEWNPDGFDFYFDGKYYGSIDSWPSAWQQADGTVVHENVPDPFNKDFYFKANVAVNGWGRKPVEQVGWDQNKMQIDYVRVYQNAGQKAAANDKYVKFDTLSAVKTPQTLNVKVGDTVNSLPNLQRPGFEFGGWYSNRSFAPEAKVQAPFSVEDDMTLFARWIGEPVTISFDSGGVGQAPAAIDTEVERTEALPNPTGSNREFVGWYLDEQLTKRVYSPLKITEPGDIVLHAKWGATLNPNVATSGGVIRQQGANRFATNAAISRATYVSDVETVYLVNGIDYPDALVASALAGDEAQPLLLVEAKRLPAEIKAELRRLAPTRVVAVGGEAVVSSAVLNEAARAAGGAKTDRYGGANRFETAAAVASAGFGQQAPIYIATGMDYPDALAASAAAGAQGGPVLLTLKDELPEPTVKALQGRTPSKLRVVGGIGVIVPEIVGESSRIAGIRGERVYGDDRYDTAVSVAQDAMGTKEISVAYVASGANFPDALSAAAPAAAYGGPVFLTVPTEVPGILPNGIASLRPDSLVVAGGPGAVSTAVESRLRTVVAGY